MVLHASEECRPFGPFQKTQNTLRTLDLRDMQDHLYALIREQPSLEIPTAYSHFEDSEVCLKSSACSGMQQVSASILLPLPGPYLTVKLKDKTRRLVVYPTSPPLHPQPSFRHLSGLCTSEFNLSYLDEWRKSQGLIPLEASTHKPLFQRATPSLCTPAKLPGPTLCCKRTK